jgi:hypothetical protein
MVIMILLRRNYAFIFTKDRGSHSMWIIADDSIDEGIWNRVWAFTDDGRPLELAKLDIALVPRVSP